MENVSCHIPKNSFSYHIAADTKNKFKNPMVYKIKYIKCS